MDITKKKEGFLIQDENEDLTHVITRKDGDFKIRYSKSELWTNSTKGREIASLKDNGNKIIIKVNDHDVEKKIKLSYDIFEEVLHIMSLKAEYDEKKFQAMLELNGRR